MHPRSVNLVNSGVGILFALGGLWSLVVHAYRDGAIWLFFGLLLLVLGTTKQSEPLPRWRIIAAILLPMAGAAILVIQALSLR